MKANPVKSHLLLSSKNLSLSAKIDSNVINNENNVKLLAITFDNDLSFNKHVSSLCNKAMQKWLAISRISGYMILEKHGLLMKAFIQSQFAYCLLTSIDVSGLTSFWHRSCSKDSKIGLCYYHQRKISTQGFFSQ